MTDAYYLDTWDGYPQARTRLISQLAEVDNPVVLTGDYHAGMVLEVRETPFDQASALVAPEFMAPPISSPLFPLDVSARTPQLLAADQRARLPDRRGHPRRADRHLPGARRHAGPGVADLHRRHLDRPGRQPRGDQGLSQQS